VPTPPDDAVPVHVAEKVTIPANSRARLTFTPEQSGTTFGVPTVAASKRNLTTYEVLADGTTRYEQAGVPPTDIDDFAPCFWPSLQFRDSMTVVIRNVDSVDRSYAIQVAGWETSEVAQ